MATWRDDKLLELASQLTYSPTEKRHEQLSGALALAEAIDPAKSYPWDFVHFRITGFQPVKHTDHVVAGKVLRADLATLIEFLSDTLSIKVEEGAGPGDAVLTAEEIANKFSISSKTLQRWRKQGMIALRYVYPDGRRRLGFLASTAAKFAAANKERVDRSAAFTQLTEEEKKRIIAEARTLASEQRLSIKEISLQLGKALNRSPETIRYTLRRYDHEHPEAAIFSGAGEASVRAGDLAEIMQLFEKGEPLEQLAVRYSRTIAGISQIVTQERASRLKNAPIEFTPNPLFDHPDAESIILQVLPAAALAKAQVTVAAGTNTKANDVYMARTPRDLPAFLQEIFHQPVMPQELEADAFRQMNYLKSKAAKLQKQLEPAAATAEQLAAIEALLVRANEVKNGIVQNNLRVAVHVSRKHQRPDRPLIELFSDATIWLMRAVDKFDFARNTRFTTYASYAIMKNFARDRAEQLTRRDSKMLTGQEEILRAVGSREGHPAQEPQDAAHLQADLLSVLKELPAREQELLTHHYGLDQQQKPLSLSEIGDKMGITKARVQQLEARALRKLRQLLDTRREHLHNATSHPK